MHGQIDSLISDAPLRKDIGADTLRAIPCTHQAFALLGLLLLHFLDLLIREAGGQDLHGFFTITVLRTIILALYPYPGGQVSNTHRRIRFVHVLSTCPTGPESINT